MVAALHRYTHPNWPILGVLGRFWSQIDVTMPWLRLADSNLRLSPSSILDIYKVFEHIDNLSRGIC